MRLKEVVERGESLLTQIQQALHDIAQAQLESQAMEGDLHSTTTQINTGEGDFGGTQGNT